MVGDSKSSPPALVIEESTSVPLLHNAKPPFYYVKSEKPQHRVMLEYAAQGYTVKEIAEMTGFTSVAVSNILRQPHAQQVMVEEIKQQSRIDDPVIELIASNVKAAVSTLAEIMHNQDARSSDRIAAAREILDRKYGKPNQPVTHKEDVDLEKLSDAELAKLLPRAGGTVTE